MAVRVTPRTRRRILWVRVGDQRHLVVLHPTAVGYFGKVTGCIFERFVILRWEGDGQALERWVVQAERAGEQLERRGRTLADVVRIAVEWAVAR